MEALLAELQRKVDRIEEHLRGNLSVASDALLQQLLEHQTEAQVFLFSLSTNSFQRELQTTTTMQSMERD